MKPKQITYMNMETAIDETAVLVSKEAKQRIISEWHTGDKVIFTPFERVVWLDADGNGYYVANKVWTKLAKNENGEWVDIGYTI